MGPVVRLRQMPPNSALLADADLALRASFGAANRERYAVSQRTR